MFSFHTDGTAIARGLASGYEPPTVSCPTDHRVPSNYACRAGMTFVNIVTIQEAFKLNVATSNWPR